MRILCAIERAWFLLQLNARYEANCARKFTRKFGTIFVISSLWYLVCSIQRAQSPALGSVSFFCLSPSFGERTQWGPLSLWSPSFSQNSASFPCRNLKQANQKKSCLMCFFPNVFVCFGFLQENSIICVRPAFYQTVWKQGYQTNLSDRFFWEIQTNLADKCWPEKKLNHNVNMLPNVFQNMYQRYSQINVSRNLHVMFAKDGSWNGFILRDEKSDQIYCRKGLLSKRDYTNELSHKSFFIEVLKCVLVVVFNRFCSQRHHTNNFLKHISKWIL